MYIYKFTHIDTGRCYIGQTIQKPNQRRLEHINGSKVGRVKSTHHFHNALLKYGPDRFIFEVIATASTMDELNLLEQKFIKEYDSVENGFNITSGGRNSLHSPETIERMREAQRARHAKRREENGGIETINKAKGYKFSKPHPKKGKESTKWTEEAKAAHSVRMQEKADLRKLKGIS